MLVAQITDTHITTPGTLLSDIIDTAAALERAVEALNRLDPLPDVTVVTGDLVDHGEPEEYAHLRAVLAPLRIVALDTLVSGETGGALCEERLQWADHILTGAPDKPTLVLMHHPPFVTGIGRMDQFGFDGRDAFAEIVLRHPQIERIACGHLHRTIETRFAGTVVGTAPSTSHQLVLDLHPGAPPLHFAFEPSGYQLHSWSDGIGLVTHSVVIGDWPGPYSFSKKAPTN